MLDASSRGGACSAQALREAGAGDDVVLAEPGVSASSVIFCARFRACLSLAIAGLRAGSVIPSSAQSSSYLSETNTSRSAVLWYAKAKSGTDSMPAFCRALQSSAGTCMLDRSSDIVRP